MKQWHKKEISKDLIMHMHNKYKVNALKASILARRGITKGQDLLYFLEDDLRFLHSPFLFSSMTDAIERINQAKENNEKILIFGDKDVDGVTSTTVLYDYLKKDGFSVYWRLPGENGAYGLSIEAVDDFIAQGGNLIITVDCGISNNKEISHATEKGLDVIVVDHHTPPEEPPSPCIIINPKMPDSGYPFKDISGCAVAFKLVEALRYSKSVEYNNKHCLFNISINKERTKAALECLQVKNLVEEKRLITVIDLSTDNQEVINKKYMSVINFLTNQLILVWDIAVMRKKIELLFGSADVIAVIDAKAEITKFMPQLKNFDLAELKGMSKFAKYSDKEFTDIDGFYSVYVSFMQTKFAKEFPQNLVQRDADLELVGLAALADIMPLRNENRIFIRHALSTINAGKIRPGLLELMSQLDILKKKISSIDLSWTVVPNLNAAGRLGHAELAAQLFLSEDAKERYNIAEKIKKLNLERKELGAEAWSYAFPKAEESIETYNKNLCVIIDERINRGVNGILAGQLVHTFNVPAITITFTDENTAVGSMRSCRGLKVPDFLDKFDSIFINHGGHLAAGGFSFERKDLDTFKQMLLDFSKNIKLEEAKEDCIEVDAELPPEYMHPDILKLIDDFEPYGEENPSLTFMSKGLPVIDAQILGKTEPLHLKLLFDCGNTKWPALFWKEAERYKKDFNIGESLDILYQINRNVFNGKESPQIILSDIKNTRRETI